MAASRGFLSSLSSTVSDKTIIDNYFSCAEDNIFPGHFTDEHQQMFDAGSGGELYQKEGSNELPKGWAVHSSSMLAYNFFHWIGQNGMTLRIDDVLYDTVVFEEKFRCLKSFSSDGVKTSPAGGYGNANMDVVLVSRDRRKVLLYESKFTEHFSNSNSDLKKMATENSYQYPICYYKNGKKWKEIIDKVYEESQNNEGYYDGIKQDICHLLGISNMINGYTMRWSNTKKNGQYRSWLKRFGIQLNGDEEYVFKNLVYMPRTDYEDSKMATKFVDIHKRFILNIKQNDLIPKNLGVGLTTYSQLWEIVKDQLPINLREYIDSRYMLCSDYYKPKK